jgi:hypothetical protein
MNGIPLINGNEYSWGDIVCTVLGAPMTGITGIDYDDDQEVAEVYGAGSYPVARGYGRITCTAKLTLLEKEARALSEASVDGRLQRIAPFDIIVSYIPTNGNKIVHDKLRNCQFKKNSRSWAEGDTSKAMDFELLVSHIEWSGKKPSEL